MATNYSTLLFEGSKNDVVCARVGGANTTPLSFLNFFAAYFAKRNLNSGDFEKRTVPNPARIPPQTPPAGGTGAEAGRIHIPSQMFRHAESALVFRVLRKMGSDFFKQTPPNLISQCPHRSTDRTQDSGSCNRSSNLREGTNTELYK